ncbi:ArsR family transcriptional regulator [Nocardioides sp. Root190]|uniref:arsenate reductase/protein-tyrosine-phosphatase family protein n=1 Tax=Nocardioides sp. Root190 TaxID=1736488 RepID=UPI000701970B|nr:helix-turn-helix domain-containing protein [Nocardioides sp. Root190]KRB80484.1 ArsR family transcriptional regulator [Nocardioides sp. Root190]
MNIERVSGTGDELTRRTAVFAALADPTRLQVVDLLGLGDAASSELSALLGTASNLLAHHLGILESAGVIARHRSEGDGRRSYWRLVEHALDDLGAPTLPVPGRVVFVCTANSARSHLAAALWRQASPIPATSAGTHPARAIAPGALAVARRHDLDLPEVVPQHLADLAPALGADDLVVTVCDRAHEEIGSSARLHWSVPDPVAVRGRAGFDRAHDDLAARVARLTPLLARAS